MPRVVRVFFYSLGWWPLFGLAPLGVLQFVGVINKDNILPAIGLSLLIPITMTMLWLWRRHPVENEGQAMGDSVGRFFESIWIGIAWAISYALVFAIGLAILGGVVGLLLFGLRQLF
jgi:hypothetical protein